MTLVLRAVLLCGIVLRVASAQAPLSADAKKQLEYTRSHYTKYEFRIPMRDGVKLFTAVYVPKDHVAALSDPDAAHAVFGRPVRHR